MPDNFPNANSGRPTLCRSCGAIVGAGESQCAVCGAAINSSTSTQTPRPIVDREAMRFAKAVLNRPYKFTVILIVANVFVYLLMWQSSGVSNNALWAFPDHVLWTYGAKLNSSINELHEWWRFITPMFVHVNLPHLLVNMYSLWMLGPYVEKLYGSAKFIVFYVLTGIGGVVGSYLTVWPSLAVGPGRFLFKDHDVLSAGASGAIFGLVGVLFVFGIRFRKELPEGFKRAFGTGMLPIILINLFIGYLGRGFIDNAAHLGGLATGAVLALAVDYRRPGEKTGTTRLFQVLPWLAIGLVAVSFIKVGQHFRDPFPAIFVHQTEPIVEDQSQKFVAYAKAMNDAQDAFFQLIKDHDATKTDEVIKALEAAPPLDPKAEELRQTLTTLVIRAKALNAPLPNPSPRAKMDEQALTKLGQDFETWSKDYRTWLKTTGRTYGLIEATQPDSSPQ